MTRTSRSLHVFAVMAFIMPLLCGGAFAFQVDVGGRALPSERPSYLTKLKLTSPIKPIGEIRAMWVVRDALRSPEAIDRMVDFAINSRMQLLFVQVRGRGDAYYRSQTEPPPPGMAETLNEFDPLDYLLVLCRRAGISVHAWVNVFYVWSDPAVSPPAGHVVTEHPEWLLSDAAGTRMDKRKIDWWLREGIEGYYLSPSHPEVRRYLADVVSELVRSYSIDGVHLDYTRYPNASFGMNVSERTRFALTWGIDPISLRSERESMQHVVGDIAFAFYDSLYTAWRSSQVDSVVIAIHAAVGDLPLSVAVVPESERARVEKGQDWVKWVHHGHVDFVVPMAYNYSPSELGEQMQILYRSVGRDRVLPGVALHDGRDRFLVEYVDRLREDKAIGVALFSYNVLSERRFALSFIQDALLNVRIDGDTVNE